MLKHLSSITQRFNSITRCLSFITRRLSQLVCAIFLLLPALLFAQEDAAGNAMPYHERKEGFVSEEKTVPEETAMPEALIALPEDTVYVINSFDFDIKGRTKPFAIKRYIELKEGEIINGTSALLKYISDKTQKMLNERVLEKAEINYTIGSKQADGTYPVDLLIKITDTWNIIALPQPEWDDNTGFELRIKARDYNFLGTMNPLRLDLGYLYDEYKRSSFFVDLESDIPFTAFGYNWNFIFNHYFSYRPQVEEPFYYQNVTGLSMELPFKRTTFTFGFNEYVVLNQENANRYKEKYGEFQEGLYMASKLFTSWRIPTGFWVGDYGEVIYLPEVSMTFYHEFPEWDLADFREGPITSFSHSLGFSRINWIGNFRKGYSLSLSNSYSYDFFKMREEEKALTLNYSISGKAFFIINDSFGISTFVRFRQWFLHDPGYNDNAGDALRGILDKYVHANYMLSANFDFPIKILDFVPSQWFNTRKLRYFDLEFHLSPIIDMALYNDPEKKIDFSFKNMLISGGMELIVFSKFMRSLYLRASVAWNIIEQINNPGGYYLNPVLPVMPHLPEHPNREIVVVIGHHY